MLRSFPNYTQLDAKDCGPTCLRIIAKYYGRLYGLDYLREKCFITREGVSLLGVSEAAQQIGFRTLGARVTFKQFVENAQLPCILYCSQHHFVVCYAIKKKNKNDYELKISDPIGLKYSLNKNDFLNHWATGENKEEKNGLVLFLVPTPNFFILENEESVNKKGLSYYIGYLKPYTSDIFQLIIGLLAGSLLVLILPFLTQSVVDQGIMLNNMNFVTLVLIAQFVLFVTQFAIDVIRNWLLLHVNTRISIALISDFISKLMKLPMCFFDTKNIGDIMQRIGDNERIKSFLTGTALTSLFACVNFIVFFIVLAYYNCLILSVFILGNSLYVIWVWLFMHARRRLDIARFTQATTEQNNLIQLITGMQEIKLNNCEQQQRWNWEYIQVKLFKINMKSLQLGQYQQMGTIFFSQITYILISFIAARSVIQGEMTLGIMMSVSYMVGQLSNPIGQLIGFLQSAQDAKISLERLNEIHKIEDDDDEGCINNISLSKPLCLHNLSFSYDGSERNYVLNNINFHIPSKRITAIVGGSGSGKTTLIKLLMGFYKPTVGHIKIGDVKIDLVNPYCWRNNIGGVMQDGYIFSDTIVYNITAGEDQLDYSRLLQAVEVANIRDFIESLPLKYDTKIGMEGISISQGQRQRLLIARVVYKNPQILFFDEATNSLDANNEKIILNNLKEFYYGKTVVVVAHRLSTVRNADKIVVLDKGRIVEEGTHKELIAKKGYYFQLIENQLELGT